MQLINTLPIPTGSTPVPDGKIRIVCISDTHNRAEDLQVPDGHVLIHAGDFTHLGDLNDIIEFNKFLSQLPHKHKIVIAGNHELSFGYYDEALSEKKFCSLLGTSVKERFKKELQVRELKHPSQLLENCIYLKDSSVTLYGLKFYGSPWSNQRGGGWAYTTHRAWKCVWDKIPKDADVLITHGPPLGVGDLSVQQLHCGCKDLYKAVSQRVKPKLHIFGHIHEGYGLYTDGETIYANASSCKLQKALPLNLPICIDITVPSITLDQ